MTAMRMGLPASRLRVGISTNLPRHFQRLDAIVAKLKVRHAPDRALHMTFMSFGRVPVRVQVSKRCKPQELAPR